MVAKMLQDVSTYISKNLRMYGGGALEVSPKLARSVIAVFSLDLIN